MVGQDFLKIDMKGILTSFSCRVSPASFDIFYYNLFPLKEGYISLWALRIKRIRLQNLEFIFQVIGFSYKKAPSRLHCLLQTK